MHFFLIFAILIWGARAQTVPDRPVRPVYLVITPAEAAVDERVTFECVFPRHVIDKELNGGSIQYTAVALNLLRTDSGILVRQKAGCWEPQNADSANNSLARFEEPRGPPSASSSLPTGRVLLPPRNCSSMLIQYVTASSLLDGKYVCDVSFTAGGRTYFYNSEPVRLRVTGEPTPPVSRFGLINAATGVPVERGAEVPAGLRLSVVCESVPLKRPPPAITAIVTGGGVFGSHTPCARLEFYATVPREPRVNFTCRVYNGFGAPQTDEFSLTAVYGQIPSEVATLQEADVSADKELVLCSVRNNPPKRLNVTGLDPDLLQRGYPRFAELPGLSVAFAKFSSRARREGGRLATFKCGVEGSEPVLGAVRVTGPPCEFFGC